MIKVYIKQINKVLTLILFLVAFLLFGSSVKAEKAHRLNIYMFYGTGCPHCAKELEFLEEMAFEYGELVHIYEFEVYYNEVNAQRFNKALEELDVKMGGVPLTFIGDEVIVGYGSDQTTGKDIKDRVEFCLTNNCDDTLFEILKPSENDRLLGVSKKAENSNSSVEKTENKSQQEVINLPIIGEINAADVSLPFLTIIIAFMDGFNPCAMWVLIFLITMLINMQDKRKLYILGTVFIATSALVYFIFLAAWFNFFQFVGYVYWIKVVIGLLALVTGVIHLRNALKSKGECHVTNAEQRKSIMDRIKSITKENNLWLAILGMIALAISVNLVEVVCSAGLPAVYTNLLASANLSFVQYYAYLFLYILVFMIDDLVIFFVAIKSFQAIGITSKYSKYSSLIGGLIMIIIGFLLIFKPELLMFG